MNMLHHLIIAQEWRYDAVVPAAASSHRGRKGGHEPNWGYDLSKPRPAEGRWIR